MFYLVGLGNPGDKYTNTRHNIGWVALDFVREHFGFSSVHESSKHSGRTANGIIAEQEVISLYPDTYMNNSGSSIAKLVSKNDIANLIVIHDDVDLPFGEIKIVTGRGAGGNNGVKSIINKLGSKDFVRIRVGIAPRSFWTGEVKRPEAGGSLERFVLKPFTGKEAKQIDDIVKRIAGAVETVIKEGAETAMNRYN